MGKQLYSFNYSQDIIQLQTKYAIFKRVANILFAVSFDDGFDEALMKRSLQLLTDRNDCLRIRFVKDGKTTKEYFEESRLIGDIPSKRFFTMGQMDAFIRRFRRGMIRVDKGEAFRAVFVTDPAGKQSVLIKISHFTLNDVPFGAGRSTVASCALYANSYCVNSNKYSRTFF